MDEEAIKKFDFYTYQTLRVVPTKKQVFLNLYGDENNYKPFPDKGDKIRDDKLVFALRDLTLDINNNDANDKVSILTPVLMSYKNLMEFDPNFDKGYYATEQGGIVTSIKVMKPKASESIYTQVDYYANKEITFNREMVEIYHKLNDNRLSPRLTNEISMAMAYDNKNVKKFRFWKLI